MKQSIYQKKRKDILKQKALKLYRQGFTLREVGKAMGKSHQWVADMLAGDNSLDKI